MSLCQRNLECMPNCCLVDFQVRLAVIKAGMTEDGLYRLHVAGRSQHLPPTSARRCATPPLDTRLPVEPSNGLLERITGPVNIWPSVQLTMLERQFKGLTLVCSNQLRTWAQASVFVSTGRAPAAAQANSDPAFQGVKASRHHGWSDTHCAVDSP